jgi:hypothetical protein
MRSILLPAIALLALTLGCRASAQPIAVAGGEPSPVPADTSTTTAQPAGNGPEQAGDLYQAKMSSTGDVVPSPGQSDPVPGALNPPSELLGSDKQADPKE